MTDLIELQSARLLMRRWHAADLEPFAQLCADSQVMRYFPAPYSRENVAAMIRRFRRHFAEHGFGVWALQRKDDGAFIGFTGIGHIGFEAPFGPAVEIAWRLAREHWGQGFASEAARAALRCAFERLGLEQVVAFTAVDNLPSQRVMQAIGMRHAPAEDFDHPRLPPGHALRRHVLYRLRHSEWRVGR